MFEIKLQSWFHKFIKFILILAKFRSSKPFELIQTGEGDCMATGGDDRFRRSAARSVGRQAGEVHEDVAHPF
jgi:hypothetical protein